MSRDKRKIGFALGGGGARGLAHIGVLKVLDEQGIKPDVISGTSIGAIIGALYAGGHKPVEIEQLVLGLNWKTLLSLVDVTFPVSGFFQGKRVVSLLKSIIGDLTFQQLNYTFSCVATDIVTGEQIVLKEGSLVEAVRASISLPGIFTPVAILGHYLVDGGLTNTVPVSVCRDMGADFVIGINVIPNPNKIICNPDKNTQYLGCETIESEKFEVETTSGIHGRTMKSHIDDVNSATQKFLISHRPGGWSRGHKSTPRKLQTNVSKSKIPKLIDVLSQTLTITEYHIAVENLKYADIAISPDVEKIGFWQYHNAAQAIAAGEQAARIALSSIELNV
jgi:predicted acylesterase/phospholipase RssA